MIADLEEAQSEFADALAAAEKQAAEYRDTIQKQNEIIRQEKEEAANQNQSQNPRNHHFQNSHCFCQ